MRRMCGASDNRAAQMSLTLTLSRQRQRELEFSLAARVRCNYRCHHLDEQRVVADGWCALESDSHFARDLRRFDIEIVQNLDVIAEKTDRHYGRDFAREVANRLVDVGFEPMVARTAAAALICKLPRADTEFGRDHPRRLG